MTAHAFQLDLHFVHNTRSGSSDGDLTVVHISKTLCGVVIL